MFMVSIDSKQMSMGEVNSNFRNKKKKVYNIDFYKEIKEI